MKISFSKTLEEALNTGFIYQLVEEETSLAGIANRLGFSAHGRNTVAITIFLNSNNIDFKKHEHKAKTLETRKCVQCGKEFQVSLGNKNKAKVLTCSQACSAVYPPFIKARVEAKIGVIATSYPIVAKRAGMTSCCICSETEVVDIHHLDEDSTNNDVSNLVPLCPTHHAYMHRGKADLIFSKLINYLDTRIV